MLELWRPPQGAGEPVGCLASTYTFKPDLFDEQCLGRFLAIESEPSREDLAFLLEREHRLGAAYAGVLVDFTQAGVDHSLRWDVLPVRIRGGKQHAKLSLLAWRSHVRVVVASANLTEAGYRFNREVAIAIDASPGSASRPVIEAATQFLRSLLAFVPGARTDAPEIRRALDFLERVESQTVGWSNKREPRAFRQHLVFTLPERAAQRDSEGNRVNARSSLEEAIELCRRCAGSPEEAWIASPFFDSDSSADAATASLCKAMARGIARRITFCVPTLGDPNEKPIRVAAPASLRTTSGHYSTIVGFEVLPQRDDDGNPRPWHAKMLSLQSNAYSALLAGSSNFTRAGLGIGERRNAEANVLTIAERVPHAREPGDLEAIWPEMAPIEEPSSAEVQWLGPKPELDEEQRAGGVPLPEGFVSATYRAGDHRLVALRLNPANLPDVWSVRACGQNASLLLDFEAWAALGPRECVTVDWTPLEPPERLLVRWPEGAAFWPLNVEDARQLPPPAELGEMTADDMLLVLAASDPSAAFRAWARRWRGSDGIDDDLDTAIPPDLDPLRRYDLRATFLHRIRGRARVLAQLRKNLQRPVWNIQALQWRLEGFIGIRPLAQRLMREVVEAEGKIDESLLTLADFLIVLREVDYEPVEGALTKAHFGRVYWPFLRDVAGQLNEQVHGCRGRIGRELLDFWGRVVERCRT